MTEPRPFEESVRRLLARANHEADNLGHEYLGTEHLLLGLARGREGVAVTLLQNLGVDLDGLSARVLGILQRGSASATPLAQRPYTTRTKRVFELAAQASESLGHHYVGTEHVLLGLLEEAHGIGGQVLTSSGVTIERARAEALRLLGTTPS